MNQLLYIFWNPDLVAFRLGPLSVRGYGLMWAIGIALAFLVVKPHDSFPFDSILIPFLVL